MKPPEAPSWPALGAQTQTALWAVRAGVDGWAPACTTAPPRNRGARTPGRLLALQSPPTGRARAHSPPAAVQGLVFGPLRGGDAVGSDCVYGEDCRGDSPRGHGRTARKPAHSRWPRSSAAVSGTSGDRVPTLLSQALGSRECRRGLGSRRVLCFHQGADPATRAPPSQSTPPPVSKPCRTGVTVPADKFWKDATFSCSSTQLAPHSYRAPHERHGL